MGTSILRLSAHLVRLNLQRHPRPRCRIPNSRSRVYWNSIIIFSRGVVLPVSQLGTSSTARAFLKKRHFARWPTIELRSNSSARIRRVPAVSRDWCFCDGLARGVGGEALKPSQAGSAVTVIVAANIILHCTLDSNRDPFFLHENTAIFACNFIYPPGAFRLAQ